MQSLLLQIDITEIVVHKAHQPDTIIDLFDAHSLTCERGAEIDFLFVDADSSAAGDQNSPVVERIGEFCDATIRPHGRWDEKAGLLAGCDTLPMFDVLEAQRKGDRL